MGGCEEASNKGIDASAGALVWVQRKNGTWWPGEILGPDEVPVSCLVSPKSGTPVKLLGREDVNLEWYDLEKSKHVKAFRCGEFDKCIEKAKAAAAKVSKKTVKYARREDAIILALELENARLGKNDQDFHSIKDIKEQEQHYQESSKSVHKVELDSELELSKSGVSFEDLDHLSASKEQSSHEKRRRNPSGCSENDGTKGVKRMKGLNDLGSQVAPDHGSRKRRNRQKILTKVLENNTIVSIPDSKVPALEVENGSSDKLVDVPLITEETQSAGSPILSSISQKSHVEAVSFISDEVNESGSTTSGVAADMDSIINVPRTTIKCAAEWKSKGKRNSRYTVKIIHQEEEDRFMDIDDDKSDGYLFSMKRGTRFTSKPNSEIQVNKLNGWTRSNRKPQFMSLPYRQSRSTLIPKFDPSDFMLCHRNADDSLYDVKLEVESSSCFRPQHVPFISLMSKSSGRPITGYPLEVEVLENGLSDQLILGRSQLNGNNHYEVEMPDSPCKTRYERKGGRMARKHQTLKSPRKNGALTKKTRKLSSLNRLDDNKQMDDEDQKDRMEIKFKKSAAVVCCVPLKVVFSRMNAALNSN